jgi:hypothetical protein
VPHTYIDKISQNLFIQALTHKILGPMRPGAVVCTSLPDLYLNVAECCIIERESITHFALLSAADALPPSVNKNANHQVKFRKQLNVSALTLSLL